MMRNLKIAIGMLAVAAFALGQNADKNTSGPTANDYKLQVIQPTEGAAITGRNVQVIVDLNARQQLANQEKENSNSMPQARVTVFLDNEAKGTLHDAHNVLNIDGVAPGSHKLVLEARNLSGEIIDHKEIHFVSTAATTASNAGSTASSMSHAPAPPPPAEAPSSGSSAYSSPRPTGQTSSSSAEAESSSSSGASRAPMDTGMTGSASPSTRSLPQTGSTAPLLVVAGVGLLGLGLAVRSKA
jgi:LPXTG-motif cell wall-anchored protein